MSSHYLQLFFLPHAVIISLEVAAVSLSLLILSLLLLALWSLSPGGLPWALPRGRFSIPGPPGFPLLGLLHVLSGPRPHRVLADLARRRDAASLMAFSVGLTRFVVSSDPDTAKELLASSAFADRPVKESAYELLFHRAMGFAPYGEYWRNLRRISATHLFSPKRINASEGFRREICLEMVEEIRGLIMAEGVNNGEVGVKRVLHLGSLNNVMMTVFGRRYGYHDFDEALGGEGYELEKMVREGYELLGAFNWSDHFPLLGSLDLQGVRKRCRRLVSKVNVFVGKIIQEHRAKRGVGSNGGGGEDFVDVLLDLEKEDKLTDSDMIAVLWEMIFRGTDTVAILLEWILARMVLHPEIQSKAQSEIDAVVGGNYSFSTGRPMISDSDIPNLPYLQAIVKETLRMHPPGPLLSWARLATEDVHMGDGRVVPGGTTGMVNMWAITHDERVWPEPLEYRPERFMEGGTGGGDQIIMIMGSDLRLAPFGSGRRVCPGKSMAMATVLLWLAQLLHTFKWLPSPHHAVDLSETLNLSLEMNNPLICKPVPRLHSCFSN